MRLLVSGATRDVTHWLDVAPDRMGVLLTPSAGNAIPSKGVPYAVDNDCFNGLKPGPWMRLLARLAESDHKPIWVACPDAVADAGATWSLYDVWAPVLRSLGLPVALVLQDGLEKLKHRAFLPSAWNDLTAVFVGGSTEWKLSDHAANFIREAKDRGKLVHIGRVNSMRRIQYFARLKPDSIDGSGFSKWAKRIGPGLRWIEVAMADEQLVMFGGNA